MPTCNSGGASRGGGAKAGSTTSAMSTGTRSTVTASASRGTAKKSTRATSTFKSPFRPGSNPDNVAKFMMSDNVLRQKMTKLASDIKSGKEKNSVNTWKPLIQEATGKFTAKTGTKFGLYIAEQNMLAEALMEYYGI